MRRKGHGLLPLKEYVEHEALVHRQQMVRWQSKGGRSFVVVSWQRFLVSNVARLPAFLVALLLAVMSMGLSAGMAAY